MAPGLEEKAGAIFDLGPNDRKAGPGDVAGERRLWKRGRPARMDGRDGMPESGRNGADGTLEVSILGHRRPARMLAEPPYDPANARLRGAAGG